MEITPSAGRAAPVFILSFQHRDELAAIAAQEGWEVIAARRAEAIERRFVASGAQIAVVDARGAEDEAIAAIRMLADVAQATGAALVAIVTPARQLIREAYEAGATHFLAASFDATEFLCTLRFALRFGERVRGGAGRGRRDQAIASEQVEFWRWTPGSGLVTLSPALAKRLGASAGTLDLKAVRGRLDRTGRRAAYGAVSRVRRGETPTAFAHAFGRGRMAHHVHLDHATGAVVGRVEELPALWIDAPGRDPLTRLADAPSARRWLAQRLAAPMLAGPRVIVIMLALNRFDTINAAFGRATGDALLEMAARRIDRAAADVAAARSVARIGGSRFLIGLAFPASMAEAQVLAEAIAAALARPFVVRDRVVSLSARIGLSEDEGEAGVEPILRRASIALAETREADGAAIRTRGATEERASAAESRLEVELRRALDNDEIEVLFQPQVAIATGEVCGVEALARWRHPTHGELSAQALFAAAERSDFTVQLSEHIQRRALELAAAWPPALARLRLAINITAGDIAGPRFVTSLLERIEASGLAPGRVTVEITETSLIDDLPAASALLARLRAAHLRVAIDDFGTGYSSLAYLKALPLDYLKIDRTLTQDIDGTPRDRLVVLSVIDLARSLGLSVVAEGVETSTQLASLAQAGCNFYQGFLFAGPLDSAALAERAG